MIKKFQSIIESSGLPFKKGGLAVSVKHFVSSVVEEQVAFVYHIANS